MPWVVAAEINRVLQPGGLTYHAAPQCFPVHEAPNDFWRFTDEALMILFGPTSGFEVLRCGMADRMRVYPEHDRPGPELQTPFAYGYATAFILARKVAEIESLGSPVDEIAAHSLRYPLS